MEKIKLADGTEKEVLTLEEIAALNETKKKAEELAVAFASLETEKKKLEENQDPNWKEVRKQLEQKKILEAELAKHGKKLNEDGTISSAGGNENKSITMEEMIRQAQMAGMGVVLNTHLETKLGSLDEATRNVVKAKYAKLTTGETVATINDMNKFLEESLRAVGVKVEPPTGTRGMPHYAPPNFGQGEGKVTEKAKEIASVFGTPVERLEKSNEITLDMIKGNSSK